MYRVDSLPLNVDKCKVSAYYIIKLKNAFFAVNFLNFTHMLLESGFTIMRHIFISILGV